MTQKSAIYEGWVRHRRHDPVSHEFRYPLFMAYLDLDELPWVLDPYRGWSARRPALARFRRSDYLGDPERPLAECVREAVFERSGTEPAGPIRLLTNLRYFGHAFNPVSFYYCFDEQGERVESVLAEVTNTPWGESHSYLLGRPAGSEGVIRNEVVKAFHVSPLMDMEHTYDWRSSQPGSRLQVHIDSQASESERHTFDATLSLERRELSHTTMRRVLVRYPAMTTQVVAKIYWQSLRLWLKGAPYSAHPERS
ncbi:MAG: DUF1365 domain-containing protein [Solirubrobacterales bacterium]